MRQGLEVRIQESEFKNQQSKSVFIFFLLFTIHCSLFTAFSGCASDASKKEDADIHYKIGETHLKAGNIPEAMKELTTAVEKYPNDASFHNTLALAYFKKDMYDEAIKHFKEAIKINPKFSDAHTNLAAVYINKKEWDFAIEEAKLALADIFYTTPEFAYFNMGSAFYEKGDYAKAEESYKKVIQSNPKYIVAYNNLGLTYIKMNRDKEAADIFRVAIKNAPNYIDAHYYLGRTLLNIKDNKGALSEFQEVIRIAPESEMAKSAKEYINLLK